MTLRFDPNTEEGRRLEEDAARKANWKRWGTYLSERQWGTVREDYSADGNAWNDFPHDHARSRAYRWGEDGLLGFCDREGRLCFSVALWNEKDPFLKERLFGLAGPQGNHGEDVKELYHFLDATPTYSYARGLYVYPHAEYPYQALLDENARRGKEDGEFELWHTGVLDRGLFEVEVEYAKASPEDILIRLTITNRAEVAARLHVLPTLWFRNTWSWNRTGEDYARKPSLTRVDARTVRAEHETLGKFTFAIDDVQGRMAELLFTENETNAERLFRSKNRSPYVKDAFHASVVGGDKAAVNPAGQGTKACAHAVLELPPGAKVQWNLRLWRDEEATPRGPTPSAKHSPFADADAVFKQRLDEADRFYESVLPKDSTPEQRNVGRQAFASLLWSKQFYEFIVDHWLQGDPPIAPPPERREIRNSQWTHLYARNVLSMPDTWEYPWFAAWDLAFHMVPLASVDPQDAKAQLLLFLREWFMHPNGQIPAYEYNFSDVNPPVHAWACWRVYRANPPGQRDRQFLERAFQKLLFNFGWWVNRKDPDGDNLFSGGFLGLDNIGVFDRSHLRPEQGTLAQADGTAWMGFFCATMLRIALELAREDRSYADLASKFFEHFLQISSAINTLGGTGLWDEEDGFYYDRLRTPDGVIPLKVRSMVGIIPLFACDVIEQALLDALPGFSRRAQWLLENRREWVEKITYFEAHEHGAHTARLLALPSRQRLVKVLQRVLDEGEFLSEFGVRSLSRAHRDAPFALQLGGEQFEVRYVPGESDSGMFGGNSNWRGPIWMPVNYLLIESLERYHLFYGDSLKVECPTGSGNWRNLREVAAELSARLCRIFLPDAKGRRPCHGEVERFSTDPEWRSRLLFHEYFHGDTGRGVGASHQTGWTALVIQLLERTIVGPRSGR